jgi:hypothetical protein
LRKSHLVLLILSMWSVVINLININEIRLFPRKKKYIYTSILMLLKFLSFQLTFFFFLKKKENKLTNIVNGITY